MGGKYTEAQARATANYMKDKCMIRIVVTQEKADEYKAEAEKEGKSLNRFIIDRIEKGME